MPGWSTVTIQDNVTSIAQVIFPKACTLTAIRTLVSDNVAGAAVLHIADTSNTDGIIVGSTVGRWWVTCTSPNSSDGDGLPTDGIVFRNGVTVWSTQNISGTIGRVQNVRICIR